MQDLKGLLEESGIVEHKAFLKSFVERIEVGDAEVKVVYTIPILPDSSPTEAVGVLSLIQNCSPGWIRTNSPGVPKYPGF